jgi:nitroreductase
VCLIKDNRKTAGTMEFDLVLRKRRNVYGFQDRPIAEAVLNRILENARHVPSAGFTQDFDLVVVRNAEKRVNLAKAANEKEYAIYGGVVAGFIEKAPVVVVPCGNKLRFESKYGSPAEKNARLPWWLTDCAFSSLALILSAVQEGLAASFIGAIDDGLVAKTLNLPGDGSVIPLAIVPMGYRHPKEQRFSSEMRRRVKTLRTSTNQIHWDEW